MARIDVFVHLVWSTWRRLQVIAEASEGQRHAAMAARCVSERCPPPAVGGVADHVHLLVRLDPSVPIARLVDAVKGTSSYLMNHEISPGRRFRWQERYGAVSLAPDDVPAVERYVREQRSHHRVSQLLDELEPTDAT